MSFWSEVLSAAVSFLRFSSSALTAGSSGGGGGGCGGCGVGTGAGAGGGGGGGDAGIGSATTADAMDDVVAGTTAAGRAGGGLALVGATRMPRTRDTSGGRVRLLSTESASSENTCVSRVFGVQIRAESERQTTLSRWGIATVHGDGVDVGDGAVLAASGARAVCGVLPRFLQIVLLPLLASVRSAYKVMAVVALR